MCYVQFISNGRLAPDSARCLFAHTSRFVFPPNSISCQTTFLLEGKILRTQKQSLLSSVSDVVGLYCRLAHTALLVGT